jgi:hypothetical protein
MENSCCICLKPKATLECGICKEAVCKKCALFLDEGSFAFLPKVPELLSHQVYCNPCFEANVAPALEYYNQTMERAKQVEIYYKAQGKETRLLDRRELPLSIAACPDREEALLRLAFLAVKANFSGLIDVEIIGKKIRSGAYQTQEWSGTGIPTIISAKRLCR